MKLNQTVPIVGLFTLSLAVSPLSAETWQGEAKDAWIDGKLESSYLLNTELSNFDIVTEVAGGDVTLSGFVASETHRNLAQEIAENLDGVGNVRNELVVGESDTAMSESDNDFSTAFFDMTTTVGLKSNFAVNSELSALDIDIDTEDGEVTLEGKVGTEAEKMLAEEIAASYDHVTQVDNRLAIVSD